MKINASSEFWILNVFFMLFASLAMTFEVTSEKSAMQPILYNCSSTYAFQSSRIATLIKEAYDRFEDNYANQAFYIKKGIEDRVGGGTWEVIITYNVSARYLDEI